MAMDSSLLYWDMAISFVLHLVGPLAIATIFSSMLREFSVGTRIMILIVASMLFSFIVNIGVLLFLQTTSCGGLKDAIGVVKGATVGAALTGFFMWIPSVWEGLRLSISQVFVDHKSILTPLEAAQDRILGPASMSMLTVGVGSVSSAPSVPPANPNPDDSLSEAERGDQGAQYRGSIMRGGNRLTPEEYADQTFNEIKSALAYMSAFAGAYGVGIGSRYAVNCKTAT
jgi:hypothetical protein